jgi:L-cysteate sulfo-lyase
MHLSRFPRFKLAHLPTPLEPMTNLSKMLGGPNLWIKRDDCTGLATGGNKTRKLEFLIGDALSKGADTIVTQGATQTNHGRQTVAACQIAGSLECHLLLERRVSTDVMGDDYEQQGNILIDKLFGAKLSFYQAGLDMNAIGQQYTDGLCSQGKKAYFIPGGGSNAIGALGYVNCAFELMAQANSMYLDINHLVTATGSSGTQAGLVVGMSGPQSIPVTGISVKAPKDKQVDMVLNTARATFRYMGMDENTINKKTILVDDAYTGPAYGIPTEATLEAIKLCARTESILLDPVYSGKGMAGLIGLIRQDYFNKGDNVVFLHTGGSLGLFAYKDLIAGI